MQNQVRIAPRSFKPLRAIKSCLGFFDAKLRERAERPADEVGFMSDEAERIFLAREAAQRY
jgi:hypothetical protein